MKRNKLLIVISIFSFFTASCGLLKPVSVKGISNFSTVNTGNSPEFRFDMNIYNPNKFSVIIEKLDVGVYLDTLTLAKTLLLQETEITKKESSLVAVGMTTGPAAMDGIFKTAISSLLSGNMHQQFSIRGEIKIRKFIFNKKYRFSEAIKL